LRAAVIDRAACRRDAARSVNGPDESENHGPHCVGHFRRQSEFGDDLIGLLLDGEREERTTRRFRGDEPAKPLEKLLVIGIRADDAVTLDSPGGRTAHDLLPGFNPINELGTLQRADACSRGRIHERLLFGIDFVRLKMPVEVQVVQRISPRTDRLTARK
jgi:hypothetical protein